MRTRIRIVMTKVAPSLSSVLLALSSVLFSLGCAGAPAPADETPMERGGRVWAATCDRCHNLRPPRQFAADEWPVIVDHMRTRADLTKSEAEAVAAYLRRAAGG